jgi:hypothetical protein
MPDCLASDQFGFGRKKNLMMLGPVQYRTKLAQSGIFGPVMHWNYGCRNADPGISFLDANAQIWVLV